MAIRLQDIIIGIIAFIAFTLVILSFTTDLYSEQGFNVNLSNDTDTQKLATLQEKAEEAYDDNVNLNQNLWNNTAGQPGAEITSGDISEGDLMKSSLQALTGIGDYVTVFTDMTGELFNAVGLGQKSPLFWFLTSSIILIIAFILISAVLRQGI